MNKKQQCKTARTLRRSSHSGKRRMPSHAVLRASMPRLKKGSEKHIRDERDERNGV